MRKFFSIRKMLAVAAVAIISAILLSWYCNKKVLNAAEGKTYSNTEDLPFNQTGLLLGTGMYLKNGSLNPYFQNRVVSAAELLKAGKIKYLIISGDNSREGYDEPSDMKKELVKMGIDSNCIYLDYAGFRTYDSMIRAREVFGQTKFTIISQLFHNERAIYIGTGIGLDVIAYNSGHVGGKSAMNMSFREKFARVNAWLDLIIGKSPKFLGPQVKVGP